MNPDLKTKLLELGLNEEQAGKLEAEGVNTIDDLQLLTAEEIKNTTGCNTVVSRKVHAHANPPAVPPAPATAGAPVAAADAEIPEGSSPSPAQVNSFATSLGIDGNMLTMFLMSGAMGGSGMGTMDISGVIPIPQIVAGYNPKVRNLFLMVMGQFESRFQVPIVVINEDGSVNRELTAEYMQNLEEGRDAAEDNIYFDANGAAHEVIKVGVDAQSIYDADPIASTKPLQKNGMGIGRVNWSNTNLELRQTAYYAVQTGEIDPNNDQHLSWLRDHVKPAANRLVFQGQAPRAIGAFNEARRTGSLPTLKVMLSRSPRQRETMPRRRSGAPRDLSSIGGDPRNGEA